MFQYRIVKAGTHTALEKEINDAAGEGWEPIIVYTWQTGVATADHAALLRRAKAV